ncbi:MAG: DUF523 domain-containing protein [Candidatus Eisenbacteria bacterium]|uniref:DUF523 domain-containing protein n=1 Tax=Eiseniibacteriota bacterium TaxID=2212470 RepID=A0A948RXL4_UNCEI|nr:DUF523 domain-containing protein [Candidatus Eisenbacteria bacterium]MBU1947292.1 DUF523 domain-containing protein [Candidatus Eisenbacteria bacterium]MBU2691831.1 DUF523 domain-containing protein [Candidatus Eisenbacteria bacterium]
MVRTLLSACLLGIPCRYDGASLKCPALIPSKNNLWIPVCPEQLGGLSTPREPADIQGGDGNQVLDGETLVLTRSGLDVTAAYIRGAEATLTICRELSIQVAVLKARSPSCGCRRIYRGGDLVSGVGVTTALLLRNGVSVQNEEEFAGLD